MELLTSVLGRRRGLCLHRRSQGRLPEADKKMTGAVRLHKKKSAVRRIFSTYLQFSQPGSAASALQINAVQQVSARGGAEHAPAEILDGGA